MLTRTLLYLQSWSGLLTPFSCKYHLLVVSATLPLLCSIQALLSLQESCLQNPALCRGFQWDLLANLKQSIFFFAAILLYCCIFALGHFPAENPKTFASNQGFGHWIIIFALKCLQYQRQQGSLTA